MTKSGTGWAYGFEIAMHNVMVVQVNKTKGDFMELSQICHLRAV
jgi:hypothetical protein